MEDKQLRGMTGSDRQSRGSAFKGGHALFEHGLRRVHDTGVDIAELLQSEESRGVIGILKDEGCGLIDRRCASTCRGVRLRARMDRKRVESRIVRWHDSSSRQNLFVSGKS